MSYIKLAAGLGVIAMLYALYWGIDHSGYTRGRDEVQADWDAERKQIAQESLESAQNNLQTITKLEETKNANLKTIAKLRLDIANLRVFLPTSPCVGTDTTGNGSTTGTWEQPDQAQKAFDRFTSGLESDAAEQDAVIEDCRVVIDWAKSLKK